jgi:hypothetical protein
VRVQPHGLAIGERALPQAIVQIPDDELDLLHDIALIRADAVAARSFLF